MMNDAACYVTPLGVSHALPDEGDANTYLAVVRRGRYWLVDCADSPVPRLRAAGIDPLAVEGLFITHFHPDHVYGLPAYALGLYMLAKEREHSWSGLLPIYARPEVLSRVRDLLGLFTYQGWLDALPLDYREVIPQIGVRVATTESFAISAAPTEHSLPSMAVRFDVPQSERSFVYSSDTDPSEAVVELAAGATLLFHEATGESAGHSTAVEAGEIAARAAVQRLGLIHYETNEAARVSLLEAAQKAFGGPVELLKPLQRYAW